MNKFQKIQAKFANDSFKNVESLDLSQKNLSEEIELQTILSQIENPKNKIILDLGCGSGRTSIRLAKYTKQVIGLDISKQSIAVANKTAKKYHVANFIGVVGTIESLKYTNHFDYVIMVSLVHHVDNLDNLLQHTKKVLKKAGTIIFVEFNPLNLLFIPFLIYSKAFKSHFNAGYVRSNLYTLKNIIRRNGFKSITVYRHGLLPTFLYNISLRFKDINERLNKIPGINIFAAFHIISFRNNPHKKINSKS